MNDPNEECGRCEKRRFDHNYTDYCPIVDTWSKTDKFVPTGRFLKPPFEPVDLRVFHLSGELNAVSREATEHAAARAALIAENEAVRGVLLAADWDVAPTPQEAVGKLIAEVERLRKDAHAVRVLDAWANKHAPCSVNTDNGPDSATIELYADGGDYLVEHFGATASEARAAAAKALLEEDPELGDLTNG